MDVVACILSALGGFFVAFMIFSGVTETKSDVALKLTNTMNASMLDLVTHGVIEKEKAHTVEDYFHKHIEENFSYVKATHGIEE